jgi:hypothetical protein
MFTVEISDYTSEADAQDLTGWRPLGEAPSEAEARELARLAMALKPSQARYLLANGVCRVYSLATPPGHPHPRWRVVRVRRQG